VSTGNPGQGGEQRGSLAFVPDDRELNGQNQYPSKVPATGGIHRKRSGKDGEGPFVKGVGRAERKIPDPLGVLKKEKGMGKRATPCLRKIQGRRRSSSE